MKKMNAEDYYNLANQCHQNRQNREAFEYSKKGKELSDPKYEYLFDRILSIVCFYIGEMKEGIDACNRLILSRNIPKDFKNEAFNNQYYYIDKIPIKNKQTFTLREDDIFKATSSSFVNTGEYFLGIQRYVNYTIIRQHGGYDIRDQNSRIITQNSLYKKVGNAIEDIGFLHTSIEPRREARIQGFEDMRLFFFRGEVYALAASFNYGLYELPNQVLCKLNGTEIVKVVPLTYKQHYQQKNWCPFVMNDKICCIYSFEPFRVLEIDENTGDCKEIINKEQPIDLIKFRGNTSPIFYNDEYIVVTHEYYDRNTRHYFHRILKFDKDWNIKYISNPFYFEDKQIEYVLGLDRIEKNKYLIHYSTYDNTSNFGEIEI